MLTPVFELSQNDEFVFVSIKTPYVKIADVDFFINDTVFKFYVKPYFLRLNLPGKIIEDGRESASYDVEKGTFSIKLPKLHPGETFENLDLLTTLLAPKKVSLNVKPLIEIVESDTVAKDDDQEDDSNSDEEFDWEFEQHLPQDNAEISLDETKYGFANQKGGIFKGREAELLEIAEITNPDSMAPSKRRENRHAAEDAKFDEEYYLADYFNADQIQHLLDYKPPWDAKWQQHKQISFEDDTEHPSEQEEKTVQFTDEEKDQLRRLPNRDYLLDNKEELSLFLGLVDIIYAYAYNHRTTEGENTVESPWTISRISSTFSWFDSFNSIHDVIISCARRSLSYPLYRHWSLITAVVEDTKKIFFLGRRQVLRCLLELHALCREEDPWFLLNDLYLTDYCVWIQKASLKKLSSLARNLEQVQMSKGDLAWQLEELELAACLVQKEEEKTNSAENICGTRGTASDNDRSESGNEDDTSDDGDGDSNDESGDDDDDTSDDEGDDDGDDDRDDEDDVSNRDDDCVGDLGERNKEIISETVDKKEISEAGPLQDNEIKKDTDF